MKLLRLLPIIFVSMFMSAMEMPPEEPTVGSICSECHQVIGAEELITVWEIETGFKGAKHKICFYKQKNLPPEEEEQESTPEDLNNDNREQEIPSTNTKYKPQKCKMCKELITGGGIAYVYKQGRFKSKIVPVHKQCYLDDPSKVGNIGSKKKRDKKKRNCEVS